jgi:hypothetical protein
MFFRGCAQVFRVFLLIAKTGSFPAATTLCKMGIARAFNTLARIAPEQEYLYKPEIVNRLLGLLSILTKCEHEVVADLGSAEVMSTLLVVKTTAVLLGDRATISSGALRRRGFGFV